MANAGTVTLNLDANSVKLLRELQKSKLATKRTATSMRQSMSKTFGSIKSGAKVASIALGLAAGAMARMTATSLKSADALGKQADKLGIATEKLAGMQLAAEITGSTQEALVKGLTKMQKAIVDGAAGMTTYTRAFDALNLNARDLIKLSPDQQFKLIAESLKNVATHTEKVAAFADIFGARNSLLLNLNADALERYSKEADRLGLSLSRMEVAKIEQANDAMLVARRALTGIGNSLAIAVAPMLTTVATKFSTIAGETEGFRDQTVDMFRTAVGAAGSMVDALRRVESVWDGIKVASLGALSVWQQAAVFDAQFAQFRASRDPQIFAVSPRGDQERAKLAGAEQLRSEAERALSITIAAIEESKQRINDVADAPARFREMFLAAFDAADLLPPVIEVREKLSTELTELEKAMSFLGVDTTDQLEAMSAGFKKSTRTVIEQHEALKKVLDILLELGEGQGGISLETYNRKLAESTATLFEGLEEIEVEALKRTTQFAQDAGDEMSIHAEQAARNMQDAFAEFLFDPFEDGLSGMVQGFLTAIRRMLANQAAAELFNMLGSAFGNAFGSGTTNSGINTSSLGGRRIIKKNPFEGMFPGKALGRPAAAGLPLLVGEQGPELFTPQTSGTIIPNHKLGQAETSVTYEINVDSRSDRAQIIAEMAPLLDRTMQATEARLRQQKREGRF